MATIELCTVDDVLRSPALAEYQEGEPAPDFVEFLTSAVAAFSEEAEQECGRWFKRGTYTEVLDVEPGWRTLSLRAYPIVSITSVKAAFDGDFAQGTALDGESYALLSQGRSGQVSLRVTRTGTAFGPASVQVVYEGGLAALAENLPADLRHAAIEQVAYMAKRAARPHIQGEAQQQGSVTYFRSEPFLPHVQRVLDRYRRL